MTVVATWQVTTASMSLTCHNPVSEMSKNNHFQDGHQSFQGAAFDYDFVELAMPTSWFESGDKKLAKRSCNNQSFKTWDFESALCRALAGRTRSAITTNCLQSAVRALLPSRNKSTSAADDANEFSLVVHFGIEPAARIGPSTNALHSTSIRTPPHIKSSTTASRSTDIGGSDRILSLEGVECCQKVASVGDLLQIPQRSFWLASGNRPMASGHSAILRLRSKCLGHESASSLGTMAAKAITRTDSDYLTSARLDFTSPDYRHDVPCPVR